MWAILAIFAAISLIIFWKGPNAAWGGVALGLIGGLAFAVMFFFIGKGFQFSIIGKGVVIGVLLGALAELPGRLSSKQTQ